VPAGDRTRRPLTPLRSTLRVPSTSWVSRSPGMRLLPRLAGGRALRHPTSPLVPRRVGLGRPGQQVGFSGVTCDEVRACGRVARVGRMIVPTAWLRANCLTYFSGSPRGPRRLAPSEAVRSERSTAWSASPTSPPRYATTTTTTWPAPQHHRRATPQRYPPKEDRLGPDLDLSGVAPESDRESWCRAGTMAN